MVKLAVRPVVEEALEPTVTVIDALPVPAVADGVAQLVELVAVHAQLEPFAVIARGPLPPPALKGLPRPEASTVTLHAVASCDTRKAVPPIVREPLRGEVVEFGVAENPRVTGPGPTPLPFEVTLSQDGPVTAAYEQPDGVVTLTEPEPPPEPISVLEALSETTQLTPVWLMVTV